VEKVFDSIPDGTKSPTGHDLRVNLIPRKIEACSEALGAEVASVASRSGIGNAIPQAMILGAACTSYSCVRFIFLHEGQTIGGKPELGYKSIRIGNRRGYIREFWFVSS
jgi:hypothetical protein